MRIVIEKLKMQSNPQNISENLEKICPENFKIQTFNKNLLIKIENYSKTQLSTPIG